MCSRAAGKGSTIKTTTKGNLWDTHPWPFLPLVWLGGPTAAVANATHHHPLSVNPSSTDLLETSMSLSPDNPLIHELAWCWANWFD